MPCLEPVLMMRPGRPRSIMCGANTCEPRITPQRLTANRRCQFSSGPNIFAPGEMPALFIKISVPPNRFCTALSSAIKSSTWLTSTAAAMIWPPPAGDADDSFVSASLRRSVPRSAMHTFMPRAAKRIAAASPIPDAPPVITATLSFVMAGWGTAVLLLVHRLLCFCQPSEASDLPLVFGMEGLLFALIPSHCHRRDEPATYPAQKQNPGQA